MREGRRVREGASDLRIRQRIPPLAELAAARVDERDGKKLQVFFVVAPDGLCYYFYEPME